ncbi:MAG: acyltransferase family protein [Proteobacteria bacterium]|nr:acyltransferase family protein [Pseudomonadota bacterium]
MSTDPRPDTGYVREMQIARGVGILLVTIGHSEPIAQAFPLLWEIIYSFHMPLFFFMSGFFSLRLVNSPWLREILPRTARLYLPYLTISLSYGLIKLFVPDLKRPIIPQELFGQILFYPFDNPALFLWFLYILLLMKLLSPLFRGRLPLLFLPIFMVTACWYGSVDFLGIWSLLKHLLYYNCGLLLAGYHSIFFKLLRNRSLRGIVIILFPLLFFLSAKSNNGPLPVLTALTGIWLVLSISFLRIPEKISGFLEYCGKLSLEIYLLQYYFIFPVLFAFTHIGIEPRLIVPCTFVAGFFGPILVSRLVLDKSALLALVFCGRAKRPV